MRTPEQINLSGQIIDEIGASRLATILGVSKPAITFWRKKGIPRAWMMAIRGNYGNLRSFGGEGIAGISKE